jgi:hypothetical protein
MGAADAGSGRPRLARVTGTGNRWPVGTPGQAGGRTDGLRGVAILLVVTRHSGLQSGRGGSVRSR